MKEPRVESVEKALSILEAFSKQRRALTLTEIANETGLYKSNVSRLAASLERFGYLRRDVDLRFRLGPALWRLGALYRDAFGLGEAVRPVLRDLVKKTGETASFYVPDKDERLCLYREDGEAPLGQHLEEGARLSLKAGAAGHILAAHSLGDATAKKRLAADGLCVTKGERNPKLASIAAPVFDAGGQLHGALAVSGLRERLDDAALTQIRPVIQKAAQVLGRTLP